MISFPVLPASLAVLCWLTLLLGASNAENSSCIYFAKIDPSEVYYIHNPEYPAPYTGQGMCQWTLQSAYRIQIKCNLNTPLSLECQEDRLVVQSGLNSWKKYCGKYMFSFVTDEHSVLIRFRWPSRSKGGKYFCTATAVQYEPHNMYRCSPEPIAGAYGGVEANVNEFPMMCALVDNQIKIPFCGCTIIHDKYVLTAAHCLLNRNLSNIGVLVGDHDYTTGSDTDASMIYGVEKGISHPNYNLRKRINDIAVIQVKELMLFDERVAPAYLPFQHSSDTFVGFIITVLGWGSQGFGEQMSEKLQKVIMYVSTKLHCKKTYPNVNIDHICTYGRDKDTCGMDSGGPVLWRNPYNGNWVLIGVITYGINCAGIGSVNTRVGAYIDWITSVTPDADYSTIE